MPIGYNHPALKGDAFREDVVRYSVFKPSNPDFYSVPYARFVERIASMLPEDMRRLFLIDTGALAVENAMKAAFDWKAKKNIAKGAPGGADKILYFRRAFHGRTGYALSATDSPHIAKTLHFPRFDWPMFDPPIRRFPDDPGYEARVAKCLGEIDAWCAAHPDEAAALIVEPVQGEGGVNMGEAAFMQAAQRICRERGALLVVDEVQSGAGRTGAWLAHPAAGITPDIVTMAKGLGGGFPIGAVIGYGPTTSLLLPGQHGTTFGGNPPAAAAALAVIDAVLPLLDDVVALGEWWRSELAAVPGVVEVRGRGLLIGIELDRPSAPVQHDLLDAGFITNPVTATALRLAPPLILTRDQAESFTSALAAALAGPHGGNTP